MMQQFVVEAALESTLLVGRNRATGWRACTGTQQDGETQGGHHQLHATTP
jgi:hypothetical protein